MPLPYSRADVKERARATWRGCCNVTLPSFTEDFTDINPAGIAHDIRRAAELGFWGTLVASESGTTLPEYLRFMEVAADAAPEGFRLVAHLSFDTLEDSVRVARAAEELGFEAALPAYPPQFTPQSAKEVVEYTRELSERTDLALILFAVETWGYRSMSMAGFPHEALEEMVRFETAAALKYEASAPGMVPGLADVLRRCGDHVLIQCPMEIYTPGLVDWFGMQWIGSSGYEAYGDRVPRWFALLHEGRWDEAMDLYWSYQPLREAKVGITHSVHGANLIHRPMWKYLSWLQGFNGGLLRMPQMRLQASQAGQLRKAAVASGYEVPADDSGFITGRVPAA